MVNYIYNPSSEESPSSQWYNFMQNEAYVAGIQDSVSRHTEKMKEIMEHSSKAQIRSMNDSTSAIIGSVNQGFNMLSNQLDQGFNQVVGQIKNMSDSLQKGLENLAWHFSLSIEQQRINNLLTHNIAELLRIPESQKERRYHIEQGLKFYANARFDADLLGDALENLLEAEAIEKSDYFVLHRIGMIYLYGNINIDVPKAEEYFRRSAKYAMAESHPDAVTLIDILSLDVGQDFRASKDPKNKILTLAAESYRQAGIACLIQRKLRESIELFEKSIQLNPQLDTSFFKAKALYAAEEEQEASKTLKEIFEKDDSYIYKTLSDYELISYTSVSQLLLDIRDENVTKAKKGIEDIYIEEYLLQNDDKEVRAIVENIKRLIEKNTFMDSQEALNELFKLRDWYSSVYICSKSANIEKSNDNSIMAIPTYCYDDEKKIRVITPANTWDVNDGFINGRQKDLNKTLEALNLLERRVWKISEQYSSEQYLIQLHSIEQYYFETIKSIYIGGYCYDDVLICGKKKHYKNGISNCIELYKLDYEKRESKYVRSYYPEDCDLDKDICLDTYSHSKKVAYITLEKANEGRSIIVLSESGYVEKKIALGDKDIRWMRYILDSLQWGEEDYGKINNPLPHGLSATSFCKIDTCLDLNLDSVSSTSCLFQSHSDVAHSCINHSDIYNRQISMDIKKYCRYKSLEISKINKVNLFIEAEKKKFDEQEEKERQEREKKEEQKFKPCFEQAKAMGNDGFLDETRNDQKRFFKNYKPSLELYERALLSCQNIGMPSNKYYVYTDQTTGLPYYYEHTIPNEKSDKISECDIMERLRLDIERVKQKIKR